MKYIIRIEYKNSKNEDISIRYASTEQKMPVNNAANATKFTNIKEYTRWKEATEAAPFASCELIVLNMDKEINELFNI